MKYKSIYNEIEAICYTGYNFKEVSEFCDNRITWISDIKDWSDNNPPDDLTVKLNGEYLVPGSYVVKTNDDYIIVEGYDFINLFKEEKDGE